MEDLISRQAAIDEIEYELEMIDSALDSLTFGSNARERLLQRKVEAREILNSIQQLPSVESEIVRCKDCKYWEQNAQHGYDEDNEEYHNYCARLVPDDDYYAYTREANEFCSRGERKRRGE